MDFLSLIVLSINIITTILILPYSINYFYLALRSLRWKDPIPEKYYGEEQLPTVAIQLPIYNESEVVNRLLNGVRGLKYPKDKLFIQILDDSSDNTIEIINLAIVPLKRDGFNVEVIRRKDRTGYKAGALKYGLERLETDLVALFDSDFLINPDFLMKTVHFFLENRKLAAVQTRWGYSNLNYSLFTLAMSIGLECHFLVEKIGRVRTNAFVSFNGTGGIWKREILNECGGWLSRTLAEDLDLAYRVQLKGYEIKYLTSVTNDQEIPPTIRCWIIQQSRWAKGFSQNLRYHIKSVLMTNHEKSKIQAIIHLTLYFAPLFIVINTISSISLLFLLNENLGLLSYFGLLLLATTLLTIIAYIIAIRRNKRPIYHIFLIPLFLFWGGGLVVRMAVGTVNGLIQSGGKFIRTPKFNISSKKLQLHARIPLDKVFLLELIYTIILIIGAIRGLLLGLEFISITVFYIFLTFSNLSLLYSEVKHSLSSSSE